ncbi:hypothetical protein EDF61_102382 [Arthrobacter sp. JUb115]|nr:hypothetical protein EDF61_102382 [Arthrobacter sp. JUb115]
MSSSDRAAWAVSLSVLSDSDPCSLLHWWPTCSTRKCPHSQGFRGGCHWTQCFNVLGSLAWRGRLFTSGAEKLGKQTHRNQHRRLRMKCTALELRAQTESVGCSHRKANPGHLPKPCPEGALDAGGPYPLRFGKSVSLYSVPAGAPARCRSSSAWRSSTRRILPEIVLGRSANSSRRMRLKAERCSRQ